MDWDMILEKTQWDMFWLPPNASVCEREEILYISSPRNARFLNSVYRVNPHFHELERLVDEVDQVHQGVASRWQVTPMNQSPQLESLLAAYNYEQGTIHYGYVLPVGEYQSRKVEGLEVRLIETEQGLIDSELVTQKAFDLPDDSLATAADRKIELQQCTGSNPRVQRFVIYDKKTGKPVCSGGMNVYKELSFGFLWAGGTVPEARGRGAYSLLVETRHNLAKKLGLKAVGLYANATTSAPIVEKQGFQKIKHMHQWNRPVNS